MAARKENTLGISYAKDWQGSHGASSNIIPLTTGATEAIITVISALKGKITGMAFCVPTIEVSVVEICAEIQRHANGDMRCFLGYTVEALVPQDFMSCPVHLLRVAGIIEFVKLVAWYGPIILSRKLKSYWIVTLLSSVCMSAHTGCRCTNSGNVNICCLFMTSRLTSPTYTAFILSH